MIMRCLSPSPGTPQGRASPGESHALTRSPRAPCTAGDAQLLAHPARRCQSCFSPQEPGRRMQWEGDPANAARPAP